jgi:hypothetical protein
MKASVLAVTRGDHDQKGSFDEGQSANFRDQEKARCWTLGGVYAAEKGRFF